MPSHHGGSSSKERTSLFQKTLQKYSESLDLCCMLLIYSCKLLHVAYMQNVTMPAQQEYC